MATIKQKLAVREITENHRSVSAAMRLAGYKKNTSIKPSNLTASKGFQELLDEAIPDKLLTKVHKEGLQATTFFSEGLGKGETVLIEKPDFGVRHKYLESGYKIKGKVAVESQNNTTNNFVQININAPHAKDTGDQSNGETIPRVASTTES